MTNPHIGEVFDDFVHDERMYEEVKSGALVSVLA